jgi:hypothetical protein
MTARSPAYRRLQDAPGKNATGRNHHATATYRMCIINSRLNVGRVERNTIGLCTIFQDIEILG